tara:strand:- start:510 stop:1079 length:570 start_codon:yes stop_codon:yes gene_type:complete
MSQKKDRKKILFFREPVFKVAELIFNEPNKEFHLRGISSLAGISTTAAASTIDELKEYKIICVEKTAITSKIKADQESESYRFYKKIFNIYRLERYNIINTIKDAYRAKTIILFGSFARGEDIERSDIDILILTNNKEKPDIKRFLSICEKKLNRNINLTVLKSLEKSASEFKNNIANGIILHGYLKVI